MYELIEESILDEDNIAYISYGVRYTEDDIKISDITLNKESMLSFIALINRENLQPIHLKDVVEDYLQEFL